MKFRGLLLGSVKILIAAAFVGQPLFGAEADFKKCPELAGKTVVFTLRKQYPNDHHNTATMFQCGEVNADGFARCAGDSELVLASFDSDGVCKKSETLVSAPKGVVRDPEVSYDGRKIVFSMRKSKNDSYKIYEINLGDKKLRRLTNLRDVSDIDPIYLPSGEILFSSTRAQKYCACNRHIQANLYRMNSDGSNIVRAGNSIEFEGIPSVMSDGRILYTRWEYVDRNFGGAQGLWTCNPDGTNHALYWGQSTNTAALNGIQLPDGKVLAVLSSCHDRPRGALAVIDRKIDFEGEKSVVKIVPKAAREFIGKGIDSMKKVALAFEDPEPIGGSLALASRKISTSGESVGLYLVDMDSESQKEVIMPKRSGLGVYDAKIVAPRPAPQAVPDRRGYDSRTATVYVGDVYEGTHMKSISRGDIKFLRVIEDNPKLNWSSGCWTGQGAQAPALNYDDFDNKTILGVVPVESDGSAYFTVPSDKFFYLQALDKNGRMLQSMRSGISAMPDEIVSCTGCHESRMSPPPASMKPSLALKKAPSKITPTPNSGELFSYVKRVQPIFDKHCLSCHDFGGSGASAVVLAPDKGLVFNKAYTELWHNKLLGAIGAGGDEVQEANTWGAKQSKLLEMIESKHSDVSLSRAEYDTLVEWLDLNAPYYDVDDSVYPYNPAGRSPINVQELTVLCNLCGYPRTSGSKAKPFTGDITAKCYPVEIVSFDRPEKSEILSKLKVGSPEYNCALSIIKLGAARLKSMPREDMQGRTLPEISKRRIEKFEKLWKLELANRRAVSSGKKLFDPQSL